MARKPDNDPAINAVVAAAARITYAIERSGTTRRAVAAAIGRPENSLGDTLRGAAAGKTELGIGLIAQIAQALDISPELLTTGSMNQLARFYNEREEARFADGDLHEHRSGRRVRFGPFDPEASSAYGPFDSYVIDLTGDSAQLLVGSNR